MIAEILIGSSLAIGAYQDYRTRLVSDYSWICLLIGLGIQAYFVPLVLVGFFILAGLSFILVQLRMLGQADIFALGALATIPSFFAIVFAFTFFVIAAVVHVAIRFLRKENLQTGYPFVVYSLVGFVAGALFFLRV